MRLARPARRDREGSAAVEFAMVALPFCLMMFAILELGLVFVTDSVLANATMETGRLVRTGQASAQGISNRDAFKTALCSRMGVLSADCPGRASVDVRVIPQFNIDPPDPMSGGDFNEGSLTYCNGQPGSLVLVRVWYRVPLLTSFMSQGLSRLNDGTVRMQATTAFRNEPFTPVAGATCP